MDSRIDPTTRDNDGTTISDLSNAIYLRITIPLGSYWADPTMGSRLHELFGKKDLSQNKTLATQYAQAALQPLIDSGRADQIDVNVLWPDNGRLYVFGNVYQAGVLLQTFGTYVGVSA